jgi:hypothetical protein
VIDLENNELTDGLLCQSKLSDKHHPFENIYARALNIYSSLKFSHSSETCVTVGTNPNRILRCAPSLTSSSVGVVHQSLFSEPLLTGRPLPLSPAAWSRDLSFLSYGRDSPLGPSSMMNMSQLHRHVRRLMQMEIRTKDFLVGAK